MLAKRVQMFFATASFGCFLFNPPGAFCAPQISTIEGQPAHGQLITVTGAGFGKTGPTPGLLVWDNVDNQSAYSSLPEGAAVPTDKGEWTENGNPWATPVTILRSGDTRTPTSKAVFFGKAKSDLGWPRSYSNATNRALYVTWWFKPNSSFSDKSGSNKLIRVWDDPSGNYTRASWTQMHLQYDTIDLNIVNNTSWGGWGGEIGKWNRLEFYADGNKKILKTWANGKPIHNVSDYVKSPIEKGLTVGLIGMDCNVTSNYPNFTFLMDDIYIAPTFARIEISTSSKWADATNNKEIQLVQSWSDSKITFKINQGNIPDVSNAYLYIIDSDGNANPEGYRFCPKCPVPVELKLQ